MLNNFKLKYNVKNEKFKLNNKIITNIFKPITFPTMIDTFKAYQKTVKIPHREALRDEDREKNQFLSDEDMI